MAELAPGLTSYRYSFNNPVNVIDPDGNFEYSDGYSMNSSNSGSVSITSFSGTYSTGRAEPKGQGTSQQQGGCGGQGEPPCPERDNNYLSTIKFYGTFSGENGDPEKNKEKKSDVQSGDVGNMNAATGFSMGAMANYIDMQLKRRGGADSHVLKLFWGQLKTGSVSNSLLIKVGRLAKTAGPLTGVAGLAITYYQYEMGEISQTEALSDAVMGGIGLIPHPVAVGSSLIYFGGKAIMYYGFDYNPFPQPQKNNK